MQHFTLVAGAEDAGKRIDVFLSGRLEDYSRSHLQRLIKEGNVTVGGSVIKKANRKLKAGEVIEITVPPPVEISLKPEKIELDVVYEDEDIIVVNKPQGMVVHPAPGNYSGTLVNALLAYSENLSGINGRIRPGIVHRIDKDTSGLLVVAKNDIAHRCLARQLKDKTLFRVYQTLVENNIKEDSGTIDTPIGRHPVNRKKMAVVDESKGKRAVTHFRVLERFGEYTFVEVRLETGRTHQIRVHMAYIGHPVVGDPVYGSKKNRFNLKGQLLHAFRLGFVHPSTGRYMEFEVPLPEYFERILNILRSRLK